MTARVAFRSMTLLRFGRFLTACLAVSAGLYAAEVRAAPFAATIRPDAGIVLAHDYGHDHGHGGGYRRGHDRDFGRGWGGRHDHWDRHPGRGYGRRAWGHHHHHRHGGYDRY